MDRCDKCKYFQANPPADPPYTMSFSGDMVRGGGECCCRPPTLCTENTYTIARFPLVLNEMWCGDFETKERTTPCEKKTKI